MFEETEYKEFLTVYGLIHDYRQQNTLVNNIKQRFEF